MTVRTAIATTLRRLADHIDPNHKEVAGTPVVPMLAKTRYFYLEPDVALARLTDGHHIFVDPKDQTTSTHLIANGYWEQWIHHVVCRLVSPGDRIVEVGANLGYYTISMALLAGPTGRVTAFEGNPRLCGLIRRTMEFNGYSSRVEVRNQAATDVSGPITFSVSRTNSGGGHATAHPGHPTQDMEQIEVEGVRLDDVIDGEIDFLRMDAEGSEPRILRGAERLLQNPSVTVVMEWDVFQMASRASVPDLVAWLTSLGFRFWRIEQSTVLTAIEPSELPTLTACDLVMSRHEPVIA